MEGLEEILLTKVSFKKTKTEDKGKNLNRGILSKRLDKISSLAVSFTLIHAVNTM